MARDSHLQRLQDRRQDAPRQVMDDMTAPIGLMGGDLHKLVRRLKTRRGVAPQVLSGLIPVAQISDGRSLRRVAGCNVALGIDIGANKDPLALVESSTECASLVTDRSEFLIGLHGSKAFRRSSLACRAVNTVSAPPASGRIPSDADPSRSVTRPRMPIRYIVGCTYPLLVSC